MTNAERLIKAVSNPKNRKILKRLLSELRAGNRSEATLYVKFLFLRDLANAYPKKLFQNISREDIAAFIEKKARVLKATSLVTVKAQIKHFYTWFEGDGEETPKKVRWLDTRMPNKEMTFEDMLTEDEIMRMAKVSSIRDSAIIITLFDCGMRAGEFLGLKIKDVKFNEGSVILQIPREVSKTYARPVYCVRCIPYLKSHLQTHLERENPNAPLWLSKNGKALKNWDLINILRQAAVKAGISKHVNPHLLRHSRSTEVAIRHTMNEAEMRMFFGWSRGSNMPSFYSHLTSQHLENAVRIEAGIEKIEPPEVKIKPVLCRCGINNPPTYLFCYQCGAPLGVEFSEDVSDKVLRRALTLYNKLDDKKKQAVLFAMVASVEAMLKKSEAQ